MKRSLAVSIPTSFILFRGLAGLLAIGISFFSLDPTGLVLSSLVVLGLLSDVLDGVVARKLGVSNDNLRIWDSRVDIIFFVSLIVALLLRSPNLLLPVGLFFIGIAFLELSVHLVSFVRFRKQSSTHHILSKIFSILLFGLLVQFYVYSEVTWFFWIVSLVALLSFLEAGLIMLKLNRWQCDIRTVLDIENGEVRKKSSRTS